MLTRSAARGKVREISRDNYAFQKSPGKEGA
jgi:hypothetical protein